MGKKQKKGASESLVSGLVMTCGFGLAWYLTGWWFWVFPMVFAGILPAFEGLRRMLFNYEQGKKEKLTPEQKQAFVEKELLSLAQSEGGKVTPALAAIKTSLTTERAEELLQDFAKKGYASMEVTKDGRVEFIFPEFRRNIED